MYFGEYMKKKIERSAFLSLINLQSQNNSALSKNTYDVDPLKLEKDKILKKKKKNSVPNRENSTTILKNSYEYLDNSSVSLSDKLFSPSATSSSSSLSASPSHKLENAFHTTKYYNDKNLKKNPNEAEHAQNKSYIDISMEQEKNRHIRIINYEKFEKALKSIQHKKYFKNFQIKNKENAKNSNKQFEKLFKTSKQRNHIVNNTESSKIRDNTYDKLKKELKLVSKINKITQERKKEKSIDRTQWNAKRNSNEFSVFSQNSLSSRKLEHDDEDNLYEMLDNYKNHINHEEARNITSRNDMNYKFSSVEEKKPYIRNNYDSNEKGKNMSESSIQLHMEKNKKWKDLPIQRIKMRNITVANYGKEKKKKVQCDQNAEAVYETEKNKSDLCGYNPANTIQENGELGTNLHGKKQEEKQMSQEVNYQENIQRKEKDKQTEQVHTEETNKKKQTQIEGEDKNLKVYTKFLFLSNTSESDKDTKDPETKELDVMKKNIEENMRNEKLMKVIHTNSGKLCFKNKIDKSEIGTMEETIDPSQESKNEKLELKKEYTKGSALSKRKITLEKNCNKDYELSTNYNVVSTQYTSCNEQVVLQDIEEKELPVIEETNSAIKPLYPKNDMKEQLYLNERNQKHCENRENDIKTKRVDIFVTKECTLYEKNKIDTNEKYEKQNALGNEDKNTEKSCATSKEEFKLMHSFSSSYQKEKSFLNNYCLKEHDNINDSKSDDHSSLKDSNQSMKKENGNSGIDYERTHRGSFKKNEDAYDVMVDTKDPYNMNTQDKEMISSIRENFPLEENYNTTTIDKVKFKEWKNHQVKLDYEHFEKKPLYLNETKYETISTCWNETKKIRELMKMKNPEEYHKVKSKKENLNNNTHILESINFKNVYLEYTNEKNNNTGENKSDKNHQNIKTNRRHTFIGLMEKAQNFENFQTPMSFHRNQEEMMYKRTGNGILEETEEKKYSTLVNIGNSISISCKEPNGISTEIKSEKQTKGKEEVNNPFEELFMLLEKKKKKKVLKKIEEIIESNKGMNDTISDENLLKELQKLYRRKKDRTTTEEKKNWTVIEKDKHSFTKGVKNVTTEPIIKERKTDKMNNGIKKFVNTISYSKMNDCKKEIIFKDEFVFKMGDTLNPERNKECTRQREVKKSDRKNKKIKKKKMEEPDEEEEEPPLFIFKKEKLLEDETTLLNLFELYEKRRKEEKKNMNDKIKDKETYTQKEYTKTKPTDGYTDEFENTYIHDYEKENNIIDPTERVMTKDKSKDNKLQDAQKIPKNSNYNEEDNTNKFRISYKFDLFDVYEKYCKIKSEKKKKNLFSHYTSINLQEEVAKIQKLNNRTMNSNCSLKELKRNDKHIKSESEKEIMEKDNKTDSHQIIEKYEEKDNKEKEKIHNIETLSEVEQDWKLKSASITSLGRPTTHSLRSNGSNPCSNFSSNHDMESKNRYIRNETFSVNNANGTEPKEYTKKNTYPTHLQDDSFNDHEHSLNYSISNSFTRSNEIVETQILNKKKKFFARTKVKSFKKYNIDQRKIQHGWNAKKWRNKLTRNGNKKGRRKPFDSSRTNNSQTNSNNLTNLGCLNTNKNMCNNNSSNSENEDSLAYLDSLTNYVLHMIESYYE